MRIRTGYSFHAAFGPLDDVISRLKEIGWQHAPITDRMSTFGWVRWTKAATKAGLKPVYGVELAVTERLGDKKPILDYWTFIATDDIRPVNELVNIATSNPSREPCLLYSQLEKVKGVIMIAGRNAVLKQMNPKRKDLYIGLSPSCSKGFIAEAARMKFKFMAVSDNFYPRVDDLETYRVALGMRANTQTYPRHILSDDEWKDAVAYAAGASVDLNVALINRAKAFKQCKAALRKATLLSPEKPKTLRQLCVEGAKVKGINLKDKVYKERLDRELRLIDEKKFEDYFHIIHDMIVWAKQRMIVGPARGSSCGSLVCYLLHITEVDPIPYGLIFERFIDTTRSDLPDIDIDFSDDRRKLVFEYVEKKYGIHRVARLGTVSMYKPRSALKNTAAAVKAPFWMLNKVLDNLLERSSGDARALQAVEDTLKDTDAGRKMLEEHPEMVVAGKLEGHPTNASKHAAGIVLTQDDVLNYVAVDARSNTAMCDKKDAEELNLLKIDALGLTQLSIFERTLQLIGKPDVSGFLETIPLDDPKAFDVLNQGHWSGIFQFNGMSLQTLTKQVEIDGIEDIIGITALARPGPMMSGAAGEWTKRKMGIQPVTYPHPLFEPHMRNTLGIIAYQEQVMTIGREVGGLTWEDVTALRKAMSKSMGMEFFNQYGDRFKAGGLKKGIPYEVLDKMWTDLCSYGNWCLSGSTKLVNPYPNQFFPKKTVTLKQLYKNGGLGPTLNDGTRQSKKRQKLLMWDGEYLKPFENHGVTYSGKKMTYTLTTDSGNKIRATKEHKFLQPDGSYKTLGELRVGDYVMSDAGMLPSARKAKKGTESGAHNWWNKKKSGAPMYNEGVRYLKSKYKKCQACKAAPYEETHHIDGNHENHDRSNLLPVCRVCHKKLHVAMEGKKPPPWNKGRTIFADAIKSIKRFKIEDVYDVSMPAPHHNFLAEGIVVHNCFNRSHAVAYGIVSYWACWLKAHFPVEFAAATLDAETLPEKQMMILREMREEGIDYTPIDLDHSTDKWEVARDEDGNKRLVGPLSMIKGVGVATVNEILTARKEGQPIRASLAKKLLAARTSVDTLYPFKERMEKLLPDPTEMNIHSMPTPIKEVQCGIRGSIVVFAIAKRIIPRDENEAIHVAKRKGQVYKGPHLSLGLFVGDDDDEVYAKINRFNYEKLAVPIIERGRPGKSIYAIKGTVPSGFRMISVDQVKYIGDMDERYDTER